MKKLLKTAACLGLGLFSLTTVSAKEIPLTGKDPKEYNNVLIVGNWVFQLNKYGVSPKDIMDATLDSFKTTNNDPKAYYIVGGEVYEYDQKGNKPPKELGTVEEVFADEKINALGLNGEEYEDLVLEEVEPAIRDAIATLNENAKEHGFEKITFEDNTATFYISNPGNSLADYKEQILDLIKKFTDAKYGVQTVTFNGKEYKIEDLKEDSAIVGLAVEVLTKMAGEDAKSLTYAAVANKSAEATVTYKTEDGSTYTVTYTLKFDYDFEWEKDIVLENAAEELNKKVSEEGGDTYGFSSVTYSDGTLAFDIFDPTKSLVTFADSGIVKLFQENYKGAVSVTYTAGNTTATVSLSDNITDADVKKIAKDVLVALAGENADLTLGSVANKAATATVTYADGTTVDYTLTFNFDAESVKDEILSEYAETLNEEIIKMGFKSVSYNPENNTVEFEISDPSAEFKAQIDLVAQIAGMFEKWSVGATKVTYKVNGLTDTTTVEFGQETTAETTKLALDLLTAMAGKDDPSEAVNLKIGDVAGSYAVADFYFVGSNTPITYTVKFNYDVQESLYETLQGDISGLLEIEGEDGYFDCITFDNGKATFTVKKDKSESTFASYNHKETIIQFFNDAVENATKIEWTVGEQTKSYPSEGTEAKFSAVEIAKDLLTAMAKKDGSSQTNPSQIKMNDVTGVTATAKVTYKVGNMEEVTVELQLEFVIAAEATE